MMRWAQPNDCWTHVLNTEDGNRCSMTRDPSFASRSRSKGRIGPEANGRNSGEEPLVERVRAGEESGLEERCKEADCASTVLDRGMASVQDRPGGEVSGNPGSCRSTHVRHDVRPFPPFIRPPSGVYHDPETTARLLMVDSSFS